MKARIHTLLDEGLGWDQAHTEVRRGRGEGQQPRKALCPPLPPGALGSDIKESKGQSMPLDN